MKKKYIIPSSDIIEIVAPQLMAGSTPNLDGGDLLPNEDPVLAPIFGDLPPSLTDDILF